MSHRDGESLAAVFPVDAAVAWAPKATGINATTIRARPRLKDFNTRADIRLSSTIKLMCQMEKAAGKLKLRLSLVGFATSAKLQMYLQPALFNLP
jgi:hypothetical protein